MMNQLIDHQLTVFKSLDISERSQRDQRFTLLKLKFFRHHVHVESPLRFNLMQIQQDNPSGAAWSDKQREVSVVRTAASVRMQISQHIPN